MHINELTVVSREEFLPGVYVFILKLSAPITYFPGQHVVLQIEPKIFRSYSIVAADEETMTLLIDVRIGGPASKFFEAAGKGTTLNLIGKPVGRFVVHDTGKPKVFVATGTGVAPFIPMIKATLDKNPEADVKLYFGARTVAEDYCDRLFGDYLHEKHINFEVIHCISRPDGDLPDGFRHGRVTKIVPEHLEDCRTQEFYLCGNPQMVDDIQEVLRKNGADDNLFTEKYA